MQWRQASLSRRAKLAVLWGVTLCHWAGSSWHFKGSQCSLTLNIKVPWSVATARTKYPTTWQHPQKNGMCGSTAVRNTSRLGHTDLFQMKQTRCTLLLSIFISTSVHVLDNYVPIIRRTYCIYATLAFVTLYGWLSGMQIRQPPVQSEVVCTQLASFVKDYTGMQGQQNIKKKKDILTCNSAITSQERHTHKQIKVL